MPRKRSGRACRLFAVTADAVAGVAKGARTYMQSAGQFFVDVNSASPERRKAAAEVNAAGAHYIRRRSWRRSPRPG